MMQQQLLESLLGDRMVAETAWGTTTKGRLVGVRGPWFALDPRNGPVWMRWGESVPDPENADIIYLHVSHCRSIDVAPRG